MGALHELHDQIQIELAAMVAERPEFKKILDLPFGTLSLDKATLMNMAIQRAAAKVNKNG